jgi:hypothetical protein
MDSSAQPISRSVFRVYLNKSWVRESSALAVLATAVVVFFWPVLANEAWIPHGGGDLVSFVYPMYRFAADSFQSGQIPLWNPYLYAGAPFISDNQSGVFYPFNLLLFLLKPDFTYRAIEGLVIWHFFFAGATMYGCLRWLRPADRIGRLPALLGAFSFMFSGVFITHIGNLNLIAGAAWLPLAFVGLHRAIDAPDAGSCLAWMLTSGLSLGTGTLAGHGQSTFLLASFLGVFALYRLISEQRWWAPLLLFLVGIIAVAVAAISLFPALESVRYTLRAEFNFERSTNYSLPWRGLAGMFAPDFFGRGAANFWGDWARVEYGYAGVIPWLLAATALVQRPWRRQLFYLVAGCGFLLLALGSNTPLYGLLFSWLPIVPFQVPARFVLLVDFGLAILAALGLDALMKRSLNPLTIRWILSGTVAFGLLLTLLLYRQSDLLSVIHPNREPQMLRAILVFAVLSGVSWLLILFYFQLRMSPTLFGCLALLWLAIDLIGLGQYVEIEWNDPTVGFARGSPALAFLKSDPGLHRVDIATGHWQPSLMQLEKLYDIGGVFNPLYLSNYSVYTGSMGSRGSPLYNLMGVKYVVGGKSQPPGDTNFIVPVFDSDPKVTIYLNTRSLPRVMVLYEAKVVADHDAAFAAIHQDDFDPQRTLILEDGPPLNQPAGQSHIAVLRYDLNSSAFRVTTDRPAYFLLTDIDHPNWQATDNGGQTPIFTADYALRAVYLAPGDHHLEFQFLPVGWPLGVAVSAVTWLAVVTYLLWHRRGISRKA